MMGRYVDAWIRVVHPAKGQPMVELVPSPPEGQEPPPDVYLLLVPLQPPEAFAGPLYVHRSDDRNRQLVERLLILVETGQLAAAKQALERATVEDLTVERPPLKELVEIPLGETDLPVRTINYLEAAKPPITTLGELLNRTPAELLAIAGIGESALEDIYTMLAGYGLKRGN